MGFMFRGGGKLSQLSLGANFKFVTEDDDDQLPNPPADMTTGMWQNVDSGTPANPKGKAVWTSAQLMSNYTGAAADTFV